MKLIQELAEFMSDLGVFYAVCGGHAIDLFIGEKTRPRKDLDITLFWEDRDEIIRHMLSEKWDVYEPCGDADSGFLHKINDVTVQRREKDNIWCVKPGNRSYKFDVCENGLFSVKFSGGEQTELDFIEVLFNTHKDDELLYKRNHAIGMRITDAVCEADGVPYLAPELVLLYKSPYAKNADYRSDYENAVKKMSAEQVRWFRRALGVMFADGHEWVDGRPPA